MTPREQFIRSQARKDQRYNRYLPADSPEPPDPAYQKNRRSSDLPATYQANPVARRVRIPCAFLGEPTGRDLKCFSCGGGKTTPEHGCAVFGTCSHNRIAYKFGTTDKEAYCLGCPKYEPRPVAPSDAPAGVHLLYYVWPKKTGAAVWRLNLDRLKARLPLFTGKKVVAIAKGPDADDPAEVEEYLAGTGCEFIHLWNKPALRETAAWEPLWEAVQDRRSPDDLTFFAHAKGVTKPVNPGVTIHEWAAAMYEINLDFFPLVQKHLKRYKVTGAFKKVGQGFNGSASRWHYSGTFYWVRNDEFFARNWRGIDPTWWGTESYPGVAYDQTEAGCLFGRGIVPKLNLYVRPTWDSLYPDLLTWRTEHAALRTAVPTRGGTGPR